MAIIATIGMKGESPRRAVKLGEQRARLVAGTGQPQHLLARGDIDRAVAAFDDIVGSRNRCPDRAERVQPIVRRIATVHRRNGMLIPVGKQDLLEITQEIGEAAHDLCPVPSLAAPIGLIAGPGRVRPVQPDATDPVVLEPAEIEIALVLAH